MDFVSTFSFLLFCAMTFVGFTAASTTVGLLVGDSIGVSTAVSCGLWRLTTNSLNSVTIDSDLMITTENFLNDCYTDNLSGQDCGVFDDNNLYYSNRTNVDCPFHGDVCLGGKDFTIDFDTGLIDSGLLGINSYRRPLFRRKAVCAPLVYDGWYTSLPNATTNISTISWNYGNDAMGNVTFQQNRSIIYEAQFSPTGYEVKTRSEMNINFITPG